MDFNLALQSPDNSLIVVHENGHFLELLFGESFSINTLDFANSLDEFDITNKNRPINLKAEQQKDPNIRKVVQWLHTKPQSCQLHVCGAPKLAETI